MRSHTSPDAGRQGCGCPLAEALGDCARDLGADIIEEGELAHLDHPRVLRARAANVLNLDGLVLLEVGGLGVGGEHGSRGLVALAVVVLVGGVGSSEAVVLLVLLVVAREVSRLARLVGLAVQLVPLEDALLLVNRECARAGVESEAPCRSRRCRARRRRARMPPRP